jgi:hypothetical protein
MAGMTGVAVNAQCDDDDHHIDIVVLAAIFWPITIPAALGIHFAKRWFKIGK